MNTNRLKVLLIEDNPADADFIQETLISVDKQHDFDLECANRLSRGLERLARGDVNVVLLDLSLPDSQGLDTLAKIHNYSPETPIVILTGLNDERPAIKAVQEGAQDYLVKCQVNSNLLIRTIRYAIERNQLRLQLQSMSLIDDLTGLYNRRGLFRLAEQQFKIAKRVKAGILIAFVDIDNLKDINDTLGHQEGDQTLLKTANILKTICRESDIIARLGGDEFVIIALADGENNANTLTNRLQKEVETHNNQEHNDYILSLSIGIVLQHCDPENPCSIDELLAQADKLMYEEKQNKK